MISSRAALVVLGLLLIPAQAMACSQPQGVDSTRNEVIRLINSQRAAKGLTALKDSDTLEGVAQKLACDNAARRSVSHRGADGADITRRLTRSGYSFATASENTARGSAGPKEAIKRWMASRQHRANMLMRATRDVGVGVAISPAPERKPYWVVVMAARN